MQRRKLRKQNRPSDDNEKRRGEQIIMNTRRQLLLARAAIKLGDESVLFIYHDVLDKSTIRRINALAKNNASSKTINHK